MIEWFPMAYCQLPSTGAPSSSLAWPPYTSGGYMFDRVPRLWCWLPKLAALTCCKTKGHAIKAADK